METSPKITRREFLEWLFKGSILAILLKIFAIFGIPPLLFISCTPEEQKTSTDSLLTLTEYRTATGPKEFLEAATGNLKLIFEMIRGAQLPLLEVTTGQNAPLLVNVGLVNVGLLEGAAKTTTEYAFSLRQGVDPQSALELTTVSLLANDKLAQEAVFLSDPVSRLVAALNLFNAYGIYRRVGGERDEVTEENICRLATISETTEAQRRFLHRVVEFEENLSTDVLLEIFCDPFILIKLKENAEELRRKISADCWDSIFTPEYFIADFEGLKRAFESGEIRDFLEEFLDVLSGRGFNREFTACVDMRVANSSFLDLLEQTLSDIRSGLEEVPEEIDSKRKKMVRVLGEIWGIAEEEVDKAILSPEEINAFARRAYWFQRFSNEKFFKESLKVGLRQALRIISSQAGGELNFLGAVSIDGFSLAMKQIVDYLNQAIINNDIKPETLNEAARMMRIKGGGERLAQYIEEFTHDDFGDRDFQEKLFEALIRELVEEVVERAFSNAKRMFPPFYIKSVSGDRLRSNKFSSSFCQRLFSQQIPIFDPKNSFEDSSSNSEMTYLPDLRIIKDPWILKKILFGTDAQGQPLVNGGILVNLSIGGCSPFGILIPTNFFAKFSQQIGSVQQEQKTSYSQLTNYNLVTDVEVGECHLHIPLQSEVTLGGEGIPLQFIGIIYMAMEKEDGSLGMVQPCLILKDKLGGVYISKGPKVEDVLKIKSLNIEENVSEYRVSFVSNNGKKGYFLNLPEGIYNPGLIPVHYQAYTEIKRILKGDQGDVLLRFLLSPGVTQESWGRRLLPLRYYSWNPTSGIVPKNKPQLKLILIRKIEEGKITMHPIGVGPDFPLPLINNLQIKALLEGREGVNVYVVGILSLPDSGDSLINVLKKIFGHEQAVIVVLPNQAVPVEDKMTVKEFLFRNKAALFFLISLVVEMGFRATAVGEILLKAGVGTGILDLLLLKILIEAKGLH